DPEAGGALHAACGAGRAVSAAGLAAVEHLRRTPLAAAVAERVPDEVRWLMADFAQHQLGRALTSRAWIAAVR
ncbi:MAG: hypothetical protein ABMB14_34270, partial [Myxococcota bacterium]